LSVPSPAPPTTAGALRVLLVDDEPVNSLLFEQACGLAESRIELRSAADGEEALEIARDFQPQLLVLDLHLGSAGSGLALLAPLQRLLARPVPAYLCTADTHDEVSGPAGVAGFTGVWTKPLDLRAVLATLDAHARAS
jgi:CheY-like chemotaxis protein